LGLTTNFSFFPWDFGDIASVQFLDLSGCKLKTIPFDIQSLPNLKSFSIISEFTCLYFLFSFFSFPSYSYVLNVINSILIDNPITEQFLRFSSKILESIQSLTEFHCDRIIYNLFFFYFFLFFFFFLFFVFFPIVLVPIPDNVIKALEMNKKKQGFSFSFLPFFFF